MTNMKIFRLRYLLLIAIFFFGHSVTVPAQENNSIVFTNPEVEKSQTYLNGNNYQKDLLLFLNMLESTHPAFAPGMHPPFNMEEIRDKGYVWAKNCDSDIQFWDYLQSIASTLQDNHTTLFIDFNRSRIYPFMFYQISGNYYLFTVTKPYASYLGKRIININGHPVQEVIESFRPLFCCNNDIDFEQKIRNQISFEVLWTNNPYNSPDSLLHLTFEDGTSIGLEPKTAGKRDLSALQTKPNYLTARQNSNDLFLYRIFQKQKICYLQFNLCEDQSSVRLSLLNNNRGLTPEQIEQSLAKYPRFDSFLNRMFDEISEKDIKTLVIDVRNNRGGNGNLCQLLLSWLILPEKQITGISKIRFSSLWEMFYPQTAADYKKAFAQNGIDYRLGELYDNKELSQLISRNGKTLISGMDYDALFVKNRDPEKVFKGNVVFIQNAGTYSSAGQLITDATDNHTGMVLGSESAFKPCHYGDMLTWELPNTSIKGSVSHKIFLRPDTSRYNERSIRPALNLDYTWNDILESNDIYWNWILNMYGNPQ